MGLGDKAKEAAGKAKEFLGDKTDNRKLEEEGREERQEANLQQAGEHVKDAAHDVGDTFKR